MRNKKPVHLRYRNLASMGVSLVLFLVCQNFLMAQVEVASASDQGTTVSSSAPTASIPYIKGAFRHVLDPPGQKTDTKKRKWYINDHCFFVDEDDTIHWFGITNPFPPSGKGYYGAGTHLHVGHATAKNPFGPWTEHRHAFELPEDAKKGDYVGACFVMKHGGEYFMILNHGMLLSVAKSADLETWELVKDVPKIDLGKGSRDPCVVRQDDGTYLLYATAGHGNFGAVALGESKDMQHWKQKPPAMVSDIRGNWGPLESPFVYRHGDTYYLLINHSHHQYQETIVFASKDPTHFDWDRPLCTLFGHASEIFDWKGKTYISHCGIEDRHWKKTGLYLAELGWSHTDAEPKKPRDREKE